MVYALMAERKPSLPLNRGYSFLTPQDSLFVVHVLRMTRINNDDGIDNCLLFLPLLPVDVGKIRFCLLLEDWNVIYGSAVQFMGIYVRITMH